MQNYSQLLTAQVNATRDYRNSPSISSLPPEFFSPTEMVQNCYTSYTMPWNRLESLLYHRVGIETDCYTIASPQGSSALLVARV
jgi:hypothetical protein